MEDRGGLERLVRTNAWRLVVVATATQWHASSHMLTNPPNEHEKHSPGDSWHNITPRTPNGSTLVAEWLATLPPAHAGL